MYKDITLREWQQMYKPVDKFIVQASIPNGSSKNEAFPFSIGMNHLYLTLTPIQRKEIQVGTHENLVLCAMLTRTDKRRRGKSKINRQTILNTLIKRGICNVKLKPLQYFRGLANYKFIISPEGNGIDCHRHYEAIAAGCIPIIEENSFMRRKYKNLPVLYTKDYSEINTDYLEKKYEEMLDQKYDFSPMFITSFDETNRKRIKKFSDFWCMKHQKKMFY